MSDTTKERPILFSGLMVKALLEGRKTQTRRAIKLPNFGPSQTPGYDWCFRGTHRGRGKVGGCWQDHRHADFLKLCPYGQPGDRLWVRETFATFEGSPVYKADCELACDINPDDPVWVDHRLGRVFAGNGWRPSIYMPRAASRITLEITDVRVQRLNEISEEDARAEGCDGDCGLEELRSHYPQSAVDRFLTVWNLINGPGASDANPWVRAITFRRVEGGAA